MNLDIIIDNWLAEHFSRYHVWSIPTPAYPGWAARSYIMCLDDDIMVASIREDHIRPVDDWKFCAKEKLNVCDPLFFKKFEVFMKKVSKNHKRCRRCE